MSFEEDTELRDIVMETLDQRGVVGKAKASHYFIPLTLKFKSRFP